MFILRPRTAAVFMVMFALFAGIGMGSQTLAPGLIEGLIRGRGLSMTTAGWVQSAELFCTAAMAIVLAPHAKNLPFRPIAICCAFAAVGLHAISAHVIGLPALFALRILAGIAAGVCLSLGSALIAGQRNPDGIFGAITAVASVAYGPALLFVSNSAVSPAGPYAVEALWTLVMVPFLFAKTDPLTSHGDAAQMDDQTNRLAAGMMLLGILVYIIMTSSIWFFAGSLASRLALPTEWLGQTLWAGTVVGTFSALGASLLGVRVGRAIPLLGGVLLNGFFVYLAFFTSSQNILTLSFVAAQALYNFSAVYILGTCSNLDRQGRVLSAGSSCLLVAGAISPVIIGYLAETSGMNALANVAALSTLVVAALFAGTVRISRDCADEPGLSESSLPTRVSRHVT